MADYQWTIGQSSSPDLQDTVGYFYIEDEPTLQFGALVPDTLDGNFIIGLLVGYWFGGEIVLAVDTARFQNQYIEVSFTANGTAYSWEWDFLGFRNYNAGIFGVGGQGQQLVDDLTAELGNTITATINGPFVREGVATMGYQITAIGDAASKGQYVIEERDGASITLNDGEFASFVGTAGISRRMMASNGLKLCAQHLRENGWPNPTAGNVSWVSYDLFTGGMLSGFDEAIPVLSDNQVGLIQGADFTVSYDSNSAHVIRMRERLIDASASDISEGIPRPPGINIDGSTGTLSGGTFRLVFPSGAMNADVDWGDGSAVENVTSGGTVEHTYEGGNAPFFINITGDITGLDVNAMSSGQGLNNPTSIRMLTLGGDDCTIQDPSELLSGTGANVTSYLGDARALGLGYHLASVPSATLFSILFAPTPYANAGVPGLDLTEWDVTGVTNFQSSLRVGESVPYIDVTGWDVSLGTLFTSMFDSSQEVRGLETWSFNPAGISCNQMFINSNSDVDFTGTGLIINTGSSMFDAGGVNRDRDVILDGVQFAGDIINLFNGSFFSSLRVANRISLDNTVFETAAHTPLFGSNVTAYSEVDVITTDGMVYNVSTLSGSAFGHLLSPLSDLDFTGLVCAADSNFSFFFQNAVLNSIDLTGVDTSAIINWQGTFLNFEGEIIGYEGWSLDAAIAVSNNQNALNAWTDASVDQAVLDSWVEKIYTGRLSLGMNMVIDMTGTIGLSGTYEDSATPSTGLEWAYKLNNDPDTEGFFTTTITGPGIP